MFNKFLMPITFFLIGASNLFSAWRTQCNSEPYRSPPDPCAKCAQIWPNRGPDWIITPNGGPCVDRGMDVHVTAEFIYWTAREDQLTFAVKQGNSSGNASQPNWSYDPGFKVGVGILYDHDGWDVYANYTWLRVSTSSKKVTADADEMLIIKSSYPLPAETNFASIAAKWDFDFNAVDLELGRNFFISRYLKLRPHFGMKGTWQKQDFPVTGILEIFNTEETFFYTNNIDTWGVGLRMGLDTSWHFNRCLSIVGDMALSALWQGYRTRRKVVSVEPAITEVDFSANCHRINPVIELLLGLRWETWYCCDAYHFSIEGGWEIQWWNDQNHFTTLTGQDLMGDLYMQGFTLKLRLDF